jgi:hypothetical protein
VYTCRAESSLGFDELNITVSEICKYIYKYQPTYIHQYSLSIHLACMRRIIVLE